MNCWTMVSSVTQHVQRRTCSNFHTRQDRLSAAKRFNGVFSFLFSFLFCRRINLNTNRSMAIVKGMAWKIIKKKRESGLFVDRFAGRKVSVSIKVTGAKTDDGNTFVPCVCVSDTQ